MQVKVPWVSGEPSYYMALEEHRRPRVLPLCPVSSTESHVGTEGDCWVTLPADDCNIRRV